MNQIDIKMFFRKDELQIESKSKFLLKIEEYYFGISEGRIPSKILNQLIAEIVNDKYQFYKESWEKYPKSKKRYSIFRLKDLEHPHVYFLIINFLQSQNLEPNNVKEYCKILFKMDNDEFDKILEHKNWYDTK